MSLVPFGVTREPASPARLCDAGHSRRAAICGPEQELVSSRPAGSLTLDLLSPNFLSFVSTWHAVLCYGSVTGQLQEQR